MDKALRNEEFEQKVTKSTKASFLTRLRRNTLPPSWSSWPSVKILLRKLGDAFSSHRCTEQSNSLQPKNLQPASCGMLTAYSLNRFSLGIPAGRLLLLNHHGYAFGVTLIVDGDGIVPDLAARFVDRGHAGA